MRRFAYERPTTLGEATGLLEEHGDGARLLAGGTDVVVGLRDGSLRPSVVIDLKRVDELDATIDRSEGRISFGALAVMAAIEADDGVLRHLPALAEAARVVGSIQIRNRATLAGNICNGSPAADTSPPLLVYAAVVVVEGAAGRRTVPIDDFIVGPGETALRRGELVRGIDVPLTGPGFGAAYTRLVRRRGTDLASVTLCAGVDAAGRTRLAYGSVGPRAFLAIDETGVLADRDASADDRAVVLDGMLSRAAPSERSVRAGPDYRLAMLRVLAMRAVATALERRAEGQRR